MPLCFSTLNYDMDTHRHTHTRSSLLPVSISLCLPLFSLSLFHLPIYTHLKHQHKLNLPVAIVFHRLYVYYLDWKSNAWYSPNSWTKTFASVHWSAPDFEWCSSPVSSQSPATPNLIHARKEEPSSFLVFVFCFQTHPLLCLAVFRSRKCFCCFFFKYI